MITKAIISELVSKYQVRVRIPIYDKAESSSTATPNDQLSIATICVQPGIFPNYRVGDVVWVDFEMDILSQPIVMGLLYREGISSTLPDVSANIVTAKSGATLPAGTSIGNVSPSNIKALEGVNGSIQEQLSLKGTGGGTEYPAITNAEIDDVTDS